MEAVLVGLAVYFIVTTSQRFVVIPRWIWPLLTLILAFGGITLADKPWWWALSAAGISTIVNVMETLLVVWADRAILDLPKPPIRR
jgi:hypothetical protein